MALPGITSGSGHDGDVFSLAVAPDGQRLVSGGMDGTIRLWDIRRHNLIHLCLAHNDWVRAVALSPDGPFPPQSIDRRL